MVYLKFTIASIFNILPLSKNLIYPADFYSERFIDAFPMLNEGMPHDESGVCESILKTGYKIQALYYFGVMFGFVSCKYDNYKSFITAFPLLKSVVTFRC